MSDIQIGDHVRIRHDPAFEPTQDSWHEYIGATGIVVDIDNDDTETGYGVTIAEDDDEDVHWFRDYELIRLP
jgi:hypothetical protein